MMQRSALALALLAMASVPTAALANDDGAEFWLNPSAEIALDDDTALEIETAQRSRNAVDGRADTYFARLWINQSLSKQVTLSGAVERRINDGAANETRLIQQLSTRHGVIRTRLRLEQRMVERAAQTGWRLRPRVGIAVPLDEAKHWQFKSDAELFLTLRATSPTGMTGLTGLRTQIGFGHKISDQLSLNLAYLRQQDIRENRPDTVGHAPIIGIELSF
jgi:hypothetical protein